MRIASIGIDLGKTTFHLVALDEHGTVVIKKKCDSADTAVAEIHARFPWSREVSSEPCRSPNE